MMKHLRLLLMLLVVSIVGGASAQTDYVLTSQNCDADKATFKVNNLIFKLDPAHGGNGADKGKLTFKLSKSKTYTLTLPNNLTATSISFAGYTNANTGNGTIASVQGSEDATATDLSKYVFTATKSDMTVNTVATAPLNQTGGTVTIKTGKQNQLCITITVTGTVKAATKPTITINGGNDLTLKATPTQNVDSANVIVTGEKLAANAVVNLTSDVEGISFEPSSITADAEGAFNQSVKVTYAPSSNVKNATGTITASDGTNSASINLNYSAKLVATVQKIISEATTWDFSKTGIEGGAITESITVPTLYADLGATTSEDFAADGLIYSNDGSTSSTALENNSNCRIGKATGKRYLSFTSSIAGKVEITFSSTGDKARTLVVNGENTKYTSSGDQIVGSVDVPAGEVKISGSDWIKVFKVVFTPSAASSETATITSAGWATYVTKGIVDFTATEGLTAYTAKYDASAKTITLNEIGNAVAAGTPVVLKGEAGDYTLATATEGTTPDNNDLKAATSPVTADGTQYVLAVLKDGSVGFAKATTGTIAAGKAYLVITDAQAKSFIGFGDETTGINSLNVNPATINDNAPIFNLAGQQVTKAYKGVVIQNGKKYIQK